MCFLHIMKTISEGRWHTDTQSCFQMGKKSVEWKMCTSNVVKMSLTIKVWQNQILTVEWESVLTFWVFLPYPRRIGVILAQSHPPGDLGLLQHPRVSASFCALAIITSSFKETVFSSQADKDCNKQMNKRDPGQKGTDESNDRERRKADSKSKESTLSTQHCRINCLCFLFVSASRLYSYGPKCSICISFFIFFPFNRLCLQHFRFLGKRHIARWVVSVVH